MGEQGKNGVRETCIRRGRGNQNGYVEEGVNEEMKQRINKSKEKMSTVLSHMTEDGRYPCVRAFAVVLWPHLFCSNDKMSPVI